MRILRELFTRHLLAKTFALIVAFVTVWLVNRELVMQWYDQEIPVVSPRDAVNLDERGEPYVVLTTDPDVWVGEGPGTIRMKVEGSSKELDRFKTTPRIDLRVRSIWASTRAEKREHELTQEDFAIDEPTARISVEKGLKIAVDLVETLQAVEVVLDSPGDLADGRIYSAERTDIQPRFVAVRGPRHQLRQLRDGAKLNIRLEPIGAGRRFRAGGAYRAELSEAWVRRGVKLLDPRPIDVVLGAEPEAAETIELEGRQITWRLRERDLEAIRRGELALEPEDVLECSVVLSAPASIARHFAAGGERRAELEGIVVTVDPSAVIDDLLPGKELGPRGELVVTGVPAGLRLERTVPPSFPYRVARKLANGG